MSSVAKSTETIPLHRSGRLIFHLAKRDFFPAKVTGKALLKPVAVLMETRRNKQEINACR